MKLRLPVALLAAAALAGCSDDAEVGQGLNTDLKNKLNEQTTTTVAAGPSTTPPAVGVITTAPPTTARQAAAAAVTTTTTVRATTTTVDRTFKVAINGDKSGKPPYDPGVIQVRVGTPIRFTNNDAVAHAVISREYPFRTPEIAPGQSFVFTPTKAGTFTIQDVPRNYVTGTLQVV